MLKRQVFKTANGDIEQLTIYNSTGANVVLSSFGAGVVSVNVPDKNGNIADVCLGYADPESYFEDGPCAGKIPGRFSNRIAAGTFKIGEEIYHTPINNGPNTCHSGKNGFQNRNWSLVDTDDNSVTFQYVATDGETGFPGKLTATAKYRWTENNALELELKATTDAPTIVNLTNHAYWNLAGHNSGTVLTHFLKLNADYYLPTDATLVPIGILATVEETPMDFRQAKQIGRDICQDFAALKFGKGYDNCWAINGYEAGKMKVAAILSDNSSGRVLTVSTDQPGVQIYTGNWLNGSPLNKAGRAYQDYDGVAIECQDFPDAPNKPEFPPVLLLPDQEYCRHIVFKFDAE